MLFTYKAVDASGKPVSGAIDALTIEFAINALQRRGFTLSAIVPGTPVSLFRRDIALFRRVRPKDVVMLSRQIATLFEAQVSALRVFRLLAAETEHTLLQETLLAVSDEIQGGSSISKALAKHGQVFSAFYVSMVRSGEEAGALDKTFLFLADHLERTYEVTAKAKNALIYPVFVIFTFIAVMVLMLTTVIPSVSQILLAQGGEIPLYTKVILGMSNFFVRFGWLLLVLAIAGALAFWRYGKTAPGRVFTGELKIHFPYLGELYRKLYLSRVADTLHTQLSSAIPIIKALEMTAEVVGNAVYEDALRAAAEEVKSGVSISEAFSKSPVFPGVMIQMIKVGEESGELGKILETLARFYRREVANAVDTLVSLIEPVLIVILALGVGFLLAAVLIPIYQIAGAA
ncbi:MAG: type II secretion system F family protein [Patescibacteria group bacterium]